MTLDYLEFDFSEDTEGNGSFDAMASATPEKLPALVAEVEGVLAWAHGAFGEPGALEDGASWDLELQGVHEVATPLAVSYAAPRYQLSMTPSGSGAPRTTLSLTVSGTPAFCEAFRQAFEVTG